MKPLLTVADDFGLTSGINAACLHCFNSGFLKNLALMVNAYATLDAIQIIKNNNLENFTGIHIHLGNIFTHGKLFRSDDYMRLLKEKSEKTLRNIVLSEIKVFEDLLGFRPKFINAHKELQKEKKLRDVFANYAFENNIFLRKADSLENQEDNPVNSFFISKKVRLSNFVFNEIAGEFEEIKAKLLKRLTNVKDNLLTEVIFHPGFIDKDLRLITSLVGERERDARLLTDEDFYKQILKLGFKLSSFFELKS